MIIGDMTARVLARMGAREHSVEEINIHPEFTLCTMTDPCFAVQGQCSIDHDGC